MTTKADGSRESYTYDHMGNMTSSTDGEGHTTYMEYDAPGRLTGRTDPAGRTEHYRYDMEDRLSAGVDRNGNTTRYTYNMYGSLTGRTTVSADGTRSITESFGYYPDGKLRYAIGGGMRYDYRYDAEGRLTEKSASGRTLLSYEYDLNGNRTGMTDATGKRTGYRYDSRNLLEEITDNGKSLAKYRYNADGTIKRLEVGGTLVTEYGYDADRNITSQRTVISGMERMQGTLPFMGNPDGFTKPCTLVDNTYTYDSNANRITKQTLSGITSFGYDSVNRLVSVSYPKCSEEYRYDRAGNRTARTWNTMDGTERREETYCYDPCNRVTVHEITSYRGDGTQESRKNVYAYDLQGNLLSDGDRQYSYDVMNRLAEVRNADGSWQRNRYDGEGLRAELEENGRLISFIYDGDKAVLEGTDSSTIRHIRGYELVSSDSEAAKTYYHYASDELGSITHVTDADGTVLNRYEYDAFGDFTLREETVENRFGFAGEQYDPVANLYYLRARFYNPVIGRFLQEDTYYGDGLNLYTYCHNNPVGYVDPSGHICENKQASLDHLKKQFPEMDDDQIEAEYRKVRDKCESASEARKKITGEDDPAKRMDGTVTATFKYKDKFDEAEFRRQVQNQQDGLNSMTIQQYLENKERYDREGRAKEGNAAQRQARENALEDEINRLRSIKPEMSYEMAEAKAKKWLKTQAALHDPDQIAGGDPTHVTGMGDRRINSSLGSQWKNSGNADDMYKEIKKLAEGMSKEQRESTYLNVRLIIE